MTEMTKIPTAELRTDLAESLADIRLCETALRSDVTYYSVDKSVNYRLDINRKIVDRIKAELARRAS